MRGRLFAGRLYSGRLFGAPADAGIDVEDVVVRHYGGGMNGFCIGRRTELVHPRRVEHRPANLDDDDLLALVAAMVTAIGS